MEVSQELINQFKEFTGSGNDDVARQTLKACDGNLEQAVGLFFASDGAIETNPRQNRPVQIDSDDDVQVIEELNPVENEPINLDDSEDEDGVRRPMIPVNERLVNQSYQQSYGRRSNRDPVHPVFEQYHDFLSESSHRRGPPRGNSTSADALESGTRNLAAIFRPPVDIIERRDWNSLLQLACERNRWILVNVQDASEFACQVLNRDCWSDKALKDFIKSHFLFWQDYMKNPDGARVVGYYGIRTYPAVFIVDPRTAEKVQDISTGKPSDMLTELANFYERYPTFDAYDAEFRAKMMSTFNKPSTSSAPSFNEEEKSKQHSTNGVSEQVASSSAATERVVDKPSSSIVDPETASSILAAPAKQPTAESLRERREKFLQQLEHKGTS